MHYEVELALVIGKLTRDLQASDTQGALDAIKGASSCGIVTNHERLTISSLRYRH
jgi:allophanate hydrolase subunit 1